MEEHKDIHGGSNTRTGSGRRQKAFPCKNVFHISCIFERLLCGLILGSGELLKHTERNGDKETEVVSDSISRVSCTLARGTSGCSVSLYFLFSFFWFVCVCVVYIVCLGPCSHIFPSLPPSSDAVPPSLPFFLRSHISHLWSSIFIKFNTEGRESVKPISAKHQAASLWWGIVLPWNKLPLFHLSDGHVYVQAKHKVKHQS